MSTDAKSVHSTQSRINATIRDREVKIRDGWTLLYRGNDHPFFEHRETYLFCGAYDGDRYLFEGVSPGADDVAVQRDVAREAVESGKLFCPGL